MKNRKRKSGFTLTEVLISAGILSVGFMLIAGAFPVGVKLTSMATERTIGSIAADEAVAKMKICGLIDTIPNLLAGPFLFTDQCVDYETIAGPGFIPTPDTPMDLWDPAVQYSQFYPSTNLVELEDKKYHWSALCRYNSVDDTVQVRVFVSRLGGIGVKYPDPTAPANMIDVPKPVKILAVPLQGTDSLDVSSAALSGYTTYFREGSVILDDRNGNLYTVQERDATGNIIVLDRDWLPDDQPVYDIWVLPSSVKSGTSAPFTLGGRWPCVWDFQGEI